MRKINNRNLKVFDDIMTVDEAKDTLTLEEIFMGKPFHDVIETTIDGISGIPGRNFFVNLLNLSPESFVARAIDLLGIELNINNDLVQGKGKKARYRIYMALILHECGHRKYTDFRVLHKLEEKVLKYRVIDGAPYLSSRLGSLSTGTILKIIKTICRIENYLEDGYIEIRLLVEYPGHGKYLKELRVLQLSEMPTIDEMRKEKYTEAAVVLNLLLCYAKYKVIPMDDPKYLDDPAYKLLVSLFDVIDKARHDKSMENRVYYACVVTDAYYKYFEELNKEKQKQKKQQQQQQSSSSQSSDGTGQPEDSEGNSSEGDPEQSSEDDNGSSDSGSSESSENNSDSSEESEDNTENDSEGDNESGEGGEARNGSDDAEGCAEPGDDFNLDEDSDGSGNPDENPYGDYDDGPDSEPEDTSDNASEQEDGSQNDGLQGNPKDSEESDESQNDMSGGEDSDDSSSDTSDSNTTDDEGEDGEQSDAQDDSASDASDSNVKEDEEGEKDQQSDDSDDSTGGSDSEETDSDASAQDSESSSASSSSDLGTESDSSDTENSSNSSSAGSDMPDDIPDDDYDELTEDELDELTNSGLDNTKTAEQHDGSTLPDFAPVNENEFGSVDEDADQALDNNTDDSDYGDDGLDDLLDKVAEDKVAHQLEDSTMEERKKILREFDAGTYNEEVLGNICWGNDDNLDGFEDFYSEAKAIARRLTDEFKKKIEERQQGAWNRGYYAGRRVSQTYRLDMRRCSTYDAPEDIPRLAIEVNVDLSGSMEGINIKCAKLTAMVVYIFCRDLDIPVSIHGHYARDYSSCDIVSYVERNSSDANDLYRIYNMASSDYCNRDGYAARFVSELMVRLSEPGEELLIINISDGCPTAYPSSRMAKPDIADMLTEYGRKGVHYVTVGISDDQTRLEALWCEGLSPKTAAQFLDMEDIDAMPKALVSLIKAYIENQ